MPVRNERGVLVRTVLQDVSIAYKNPMYVADMVFPIVDGVSRSQKIAKRLRGSWFRDEAQERAPGSPAVRGYNDIATSNIDPINFAYSTNIPDEEMEDYNEGSNAFVDDPEVEALEFIADKLDMKREVRTRDVIFTEDWNGNGAGGVDAEGHWGDTTAANDTFITDVLDASKAILKKTGLLPNYMLFDPTGWYKLIKGPALVDKINPSSAAAIDLAIKRLGGATISTQDIFDTSTIANLIKIPNIIIGTAIKNTAPLKENEVDNFTPQWIWQPDTGDKGMCFIYYRPDRPGRRQVSAGYQYRVRKGSGLVRENRTWYENAEHAQAYDGQEEVDISGVALDAGFLYTDITTT